MSQKPNGQAETVRMDKKKKKNNTQLCAVNNKHTLHSRLKAKKMGGKIILWKENHERAQVVILILDKIDFKINITRNEEGYFIMIKESTREENLTIKIYVHLITGTQNT